MRRISAYSLKAMMVAGALGALATGSLAQVMTDSEGRRYHVKPDGTLELTFQASDSTNASAYQGSLVVPASADERQVKGVSQLACVYCDQLERVTLEEGVEYVGFGAFSDCPRLSEVELPQTLTSLGNWAFYRDTALTSLTVPATTLRVGACAMGYCTSLSSLTIERGVRAIGSHAFYYCSQLEELLLPGYVHQIGEYAFAYCTSLRRVTCEGAPVYVTEDVFEGVDVTAIELVVPTDQVEAYREAEVWRDFQIVDGGYEALPDMPVEEGLTVKVEGTTLVVCVSGDAPALVYDVAGRRLAVCASHSGENRIALSHAQYIIRCGKERRKVAI